jgi:hypothetical protein
MVREFPKAGCSAGRDCLVLAADDPFAVEEEGN